MPEGAVPFACSLACEPEDTALPDCPHVCWEVLVEPEDTAFPDCSPVCWEVLVELCVQPAIRIPAMRSADAISISILLFFIE